MRQRKAKDLERRLRECSPYIISEPSAEVWDVCFPKAAEGRERGLYAEIGCGKGSFIIKKALAEPESDHIAIEGQETVLLRALEKTCALEEPPGNLKFVSAFVDHMEDLFREDQLDGIYLNFSDPWPKARHAKRRLTYEGRLRDYAWALKGGGFIEIKTDNDDLFDFTVEEIDKVGLDIEEFTRDLHSSGYDSARFTTEYEEKFMGVGKNINYVKVRV